MSVESFLRPDEDPAPRRRFKVGSWLLAGFPAAVLSTLPWLDLASGVEAPGLWLLPAAQTMLLPLCLVALVAAVVFAVSRRIVAALLLLGAVALAAPPALVPEPSAHITAGMPSAVSGTQLSVLSLNVNLGQADVASVAAQINRSKAQVVVLQEATEDFVASLLQDPGVKRALPHRTGSLPSVGADGTVILSGGTLREEEAAWGNTGHHFEQRTAVVTLPGMRPFRVIAVHLIPPTTSVGYWRAELKILGAYQRERTDLPLLMAGDFNSGHGVPGYRQAVEGTIDLAAVNGRLPSPTWPASPLPLGQLDHAVVRGMTPQQWSTVGIQGTDHLGLAATVLVPAI